VTSAAPIAILLLLQSKDGISQEDVGAVLGTVNTKQFSLCTTTFVTIGKIGDPLYIFQDKTNLILMDFLFY
jgi:hypothetical protein